MKNRFALLSLFLSVVFLCSCSENMLDAPTQNQETNIQTIIHDFNWMASNNGDGKKFDGKPFLSVNAAGSNGAAGVIDIDRDGISEFILAANHIPRGVPSVEVFALKENQLQSIGGFFEARDTPHILSYYMDDQKRLLFLQETEAHYGGFTNILVATYVDDFRSIPIAGQKRNYGEEGTEIYYVFSSGETIACTNDFVSGSFDQQYSATEEEYRLFLSQYMSSLTWIEDVRYDYCVQYHLDNYMDAANTIRFEEFAQAYREKDYDRFQTEEEYKKTSDMVADALYAAYIS